MEGRLLTAVLSPTVNSLLFGMPMLASLPSILLKSVLLALFAGLAAAHFRKVTVWILLSVVLAYQIVGTLGEWALKGDFYLAVQDSASAFRECFYRYSADGHVLTNY